MLEADVIIMGGGLVGLTLAVALDTHGLSSIVVEAAEQTALSAAGYDGRASAVASASGRMLDAIGVGARLAGLGCAIRTIRVSDGLAPGGLAFDAADGDDPLGVMFENRHLRAAIRAVADEAANVTIRQPTRARSVERDEAGVRVTLEDGDTLAAPLLVAAEGRNSATREAAGIAVARWRYDHHAIIGQLAHERSHGQVAYEIFYPSGPFALLPLVDLDDGRHRSAIVWTVAAKDGPALLTLGDRAFAAEAEKRMGGFLGAIDVLGPRAAYPLGFHHTTTITAERLALVGDAGHGIHPIAGQGLNLGFRDVAALAEVLVDGARLGLDLGDRQLLRRYERWRSFDTFQVAAATDGLTRLFGLPGRAASLVRRIGITAVDRLPPLKAHFMAEARGESGELPKLLAGMAV